MADNRVCFAEKMRYVATSKCKNVKIEKKHIKGSKIS
jgi:hypothetical protein